MIRLLAAVFFALFGVTAAQAHPHVWVDAAAEIVYDGSGNIAATVSPWPILRLARNEAKRRQRV